MRFVDHAQVIQHMQRRVKGYLFLWAIVCFGVLIVVIELVLTTEQREVL